MKIGTKKTFCFSTQVNLLLLNFLLLFAGSTQAITTHKTADWTVLIYVQANNNLHQYAEKNFTDMATIGSAENVNVLVEWLQPNRQGAWRYKIDQGKMTFDSCVAANSDGNNPQDLVNSMQWAVSKYPAKKKSLVLWNHGCGIIDPLWSKYRPWGNNRQFIDTEMVKNNPRIQINGLTVQNDEPTENLTRGILFNEQSKTFMTNQQLSSALAQIKKSVLGGRKIDLLGMDACLMAMLEVGYQAKNYAEIFVSSEEVELAHGWHYSSFLELLKNDSLSPTQLAQGIVLTYEKYYKNRIQFFTQSAINLNNIDALKQGLDHVITLAKKCKEAKIAIVPMVKKARSTCLQFSASSYIDLHSFLTEFQKNLTTSTSHNRLYTELKNSVTACTNLIDGTVIAHTEGQNMARAKGLSIYFPITGIDASYRKTDFAKESLWLTFLHELYA